MRNTGETERRTRETEPVQLPWYEPTVRKPCHAEPMVLYNPVKAAAFDPGSSTPPTLSAVGMLVSVERHRWIDHQGCPHELQAIRDSGDHVERLQCVEGGVTEIREAMAAVVDALRRCLIW